jgi:hypothetical protein
LQRFHAAVERYTGGKNDNIQSVHLLTGACAACKAVLENAPTADLFWKVQVADSEEVLTQAEGILEARLSLAAAAVLAGGALEQHLLHLCQRYNIQPEGQPSIAKYNNAIRAMKAKQVEAWGAIRNEAAHSPGNFKRDKAEVSRLISGVRGFLARVH